MASLESFAAVEIASADLDTQSSIAPAFVGSVDLAPTSDPSPVRTTPDGHHSVALIAAGLELTLDPRRVDYTVGATTIAICTGRPRIGGRDNCSAADIAGELQRRGASSWDWLGGRFSLVWIDLVARRIHFVTDRFGVHPVCYMRQGHSIAFSDRADCVANGGRARIDPQAIFNYVYFHVIPAPRTIFRDVVRMEPAQVVVANARGDEASFWWRPRFESVHNRSLRQLEEEFRGLIQNAVAREANAECIGSFLSGGTDSSTVAGFLGRVTQRPAVTFSIGFDAAGYDEMSYARIAAQHFGTVHHEYYVTPDDLVRSIAAVARSYDQPFGNSSALPSYYCALLAKRAGIEKLLAGDGGDELFGGNSRYAKQKVFAAYGAVPASVRVRLVEPLLLESGLGRLPLVKKGASYVEQARVLMPARMETYNLLVRFGATAIFTQRFLQEIEAAEPPTLQRTVYARTDAPSIIDRMLAYDWRFTLADNDLPKVLGTTRLAGEVVGFPLLDDELVDFSLRLSPRLKVRGLALRYFFKQALKGFLPDEIIHKRKHGFGLPFGPWLVRHDALRAMAHEALNELARRSVIRPEFVREVFSTRLSEHPGYFGEMIWILMMLERWLEAKHPGYRAA